MVATLEAGGVRDSAKFDLRTAAVQERIWRRPRCRSAETRAQREIGVCEDCRGVVVVQLGAAGLPSSRAASLDRRQRRSTRSPLTVTVPFTGEKGVDTVRYPDSLPPPDVALASAVMADGRSSRTAKVLIRD